MKILTFELTPFYENTFVLRDAGEAIVIDPGEADPALLASLSDCSVKAIINTHCHIDHCGGNAELVRRTNAPLLIHRNELPVLHSLEQQGMMFGVRSDPSPEPDGFLDEGDVVTVGAVSLKVLYTPGHSPGHISLAGDGFAFVGDVLFAGSIGRTDLPGGDYAQLIQSIRTKLLTLPDGTEVLSGHGPSTTIGRERVSNPFLV